MHTSDDDSPNQSVQLATGILLDSGTAMSCNVTSEHSLTPTSQVIKWRPRVDWMLVPWGSKFPSGRIKC